MNYIKKLQSENETLRAALEAYKTGNQTVIGYVTSPKFHNDPTVQTADIMLRLGEVKNNVNDILMKGGIHDA